MRDKKKILTLVLSEKKILSETKNHNPPFKINGRSLNQMITHSVRVKIHIVLKYYIFTSNFARIKTYDTVHFVN